MLEGHSDHYEPRKERCRTVFPNSTITTWNISNYMCIIGFVGIFFCAFFVTVLARYWFEEH